MSEMLNQLLSGPVKIVLAGMIIFVIALYLLSIIWVVRDAKARNTSSVMWGVIAIIPVAGLVAYCLLRPSLTEADQEEQEMGMELTRRQLKQFGHCPHCGYPTQDDFVACPHCHKQLRNVCTRCGRVLEPDWTICPYCTTPVGRAK